MKRIIQMRVFVVVVVVIFVALVSTSLIEGQEVEDESEFDYIRGSERGPERWGLIHKEWEACSNGKLQSPIDLFNPRVEVVPYNQKIDFSYNPSHATMKNRGHDIEVKWANESSKIRINSTEYVLRQLHWHSPSEHTIRGRRYDMELHLVHQNPHPNAHTKIAVIGLLYQLGKPDNFLNEMMRNIHRVSNSSEEIEVGVINPAKIIKGRGRKYYRYMGSLTTPPCTEGVLWTVDTEIGTVSHKQMETLRQAVHDHAEENTRPTQASNGRKISLFESCKSASKLHS